MNIHKDIKSGIIGSVVGAGALAIVGFSWGGWVTGGDANRQADRYAEEQVVAALVPICIEQSKVDPDSVMLLDQLKSTNSYKRTDVVVDAGWATMPGAEKANRPVAIECASRIGDAF